MAELNLELFQPRTLTTAINKIKTTNATFLNDVFNAKEGSDSDIVTIEVREGSQRLAPAVSRESAGVPVRRTGFTAKQLQLPRFRAYYTLTPSDVRNVQFLQQGSADVWVQQRMTEMLTMKLAEMRAEFERRMERMAVQQLITGKISPEVDDEIKIELDFGFTPEQIVTLSGTSRWGQSAADPLTNLRTWKRQIQRLSQARSVKAYIGHNVLETLYKDATLRNQLHTSNLAIGSIDGNRSDNYVGRLMGVNLYEYSEEYQDSTGQKEMFSPNSLVMIGEGTTAFRHHYSRPYDFKASAPTPFFATSVITDQPSAIQIIAESVSAPAIWDAGAVVSATVV
jgi:hypothetical protein